MDMMQLVVLQLIIVQNSTHSLLIDILFQISRLSKFQVGVLTNDHVETPSLKDLTLGPARGSSNNFHYANLNLNGLILV